MPIDADAPGIGNDSFDYFLLSRGDLCVGRSANRKKATVGARIDSNGHERIGERPRSPCDESDAPSIADEDSGASHFSPAASQFRAPGRGPHVRT